MPDLLQTLMEQFAAMPPEALAEADKVMADFLGRPWTPNPGPQTTAYYSDADILLYGGAAGGGKTDLICGLAMNEHTNTVVFRRAYVDLQGFEQRLLEINGGRSGYRGDIMALHRPDGRVIEMGALQNPGAELGWRGRPHDLIAFDEGSQIPLAKVLFVLGWLRSTRPGQRKRVIIASNPPMAGEGEWMSQWFGPWVDPLFANPAAPGELRWGVRDADGNVVWQEGPGFYVLEGEGHNSFWRKATPEEQAAAEREDPDSEAREALSYTFVPALLDDNPFLRGTGYRKQLQNLPEPMRSQLLKGDFTAGRSDHEWQIIPTAWIDAAIARWQAAQQREISRQMVSLGVDVAQGGPDKTTLSALYTGNYFAEIEEHPGSITKDGPSVAGLIVKKVRDKANIAIDLTGGWGGSARDILRGLDIEVFGIVFSEGSNARSKDGKMTMRNMRSEVWWKFREALDPESGENIMLPPDRVLKAQLTAPHWKLVGSAIVVESKEELRKRLGTSTDKADAALMAWKRRVRLWEEPKRRPGDAGGTLTRAREREERREDIA